MLIPVNQFFDSLPEKHCHVCDLTMEELADCYQTICHRCDNVTFYNVRDSGRMALGGQGSGTPVIRLADRS